MAKNIFRRVSEKIQNDGLIPTLYAVARRVGIYCVFIPLCIFIRLIRPIIFIRFGNLSADKVGPLALIPELYLCEKDHHIQPDNTLDIFHEGYGMYGYACNYQLLKMWKRVFSNRERVLLLGGIAAHIQQVFNTFSLGGDHIIRQQERDFFGLAEKSAIHLEFSSDEVMQANLEMKRMGTAKGDSYVCILNRGQKYLETTNPQRNWDDQIFRNCSIEDYMLAAKALVARGHYVIRMGSIVDDLMKTEDPRIIEYSRKGFRTELLDIYLSANCHFFVSCGTGLDAVPLIFRRPVVIVNLSQFEHVYGWPKCITIFKKYWLKKERRFMMFEEILESGAGRLHFSEQVANMGIELIENTPEEILDVCIEMDERLKGNWQTTDEDEDLQKAFWSIWKPSDINKSFRGRRIGTKFLRENRDLLK